MDKKVSVIVNFHNGDKYLYDCIKSILNQSYNNLEIILWDNFSSDNSFKIIKKFNDHRIKYFFNKIKEPLYKARNQAILASTGDLIAFLDSDDWWEDNYISSRAKLFSDENYHYYYCNAKIFYEKTKKNRTYKNYTLPDGKIFDSLSRDYFITISGVIFKRDIFSKFGMFNEIFNIIGDYDFIMKISKSCNAHAINSPMINYRIHKNNFSKLHSKMFYEEYKIWFDENYRNKKNQEFLKNISFFKDKLNYLEISHLLINSEKKYSLLKKISKHNIILEKVKFLILFLVPKKFFKFLKK